MSESATTDGAVCLCVSEQRVLFAVRGGRKLRRLSRCFCCPANMNVDATHSTAESDVRGRRCFTPCDVGCTFCCDRWWVSVRNRKFVERWG